MLQGSLITLAHQHLFAPESNNDVHVVWGEENAPNVEEYCILKAPFCQGACNKKHSLRYGYIPEI